MTAEQMRAELIALCERVSALEVDAAAADEAAAIELAIQRLAARLSGMAAAPTAGRWYVINRDGLATLCRDEDDARIVAAESDTQFPRGGPHIAAQLVPSQGVQQ